MKINKIKLSILMILSGLCLNAQSFTEHKDTNINKANNVSIEANHSEENKIFNKGWLFELSDKAEYSNSNFDDSNWRKLNLAHDWSFENGYSKDAAQGDRGGYGIGGIGWYRKHFNLSKADLENKNIFIDFEGVYMNSEVWINGNLLGKRTYGYVPFSYNLTKYLKEGDNLISVRVDNEKEPSARWYHGCGIYGNVYLRSEDPTYFEANGTFVKTFNVSESNAKINISTEIISDKEQKNLALALSIVDKKSMKEIARNEIQNVNLVKGLDSLKITCDLKKPKLWSPESPSLYIAKLSLLSDNKEVIAEKSINFGVRKIEFFPKQGFLLNGKVYKLQGVCEHLEGGPTGAILNKKLFRWRVALLKDMGCNAIRTAHNAFLPEFYDICDEMGMLVLNEVFDGWRKKATYDYGAQAFDKDWQKDLRAIIRRDRNHPCVFLYSLGNETSGKIASKLVDLCHKEDPTRRVTSGSAEHKAMDVDGWNGASENLAFMKNYKPAKQAFIGTENPHTWQVRGFYRTQTWYRDGYPNAKQKPEFIPNLTEKEIFFYDWINPKNRENKKQVFNSSYDNATKTITARHSIELLRKYNWYSGSFRWTGFDYRGEAGYVHGGWPFRAFMGGALDLAGFEKDLYYLYQSEWTSKDMVHILPHWSHPKMEKGEEIPVLAYTTGDEVELFLNGKSLSKKKKGSTWDTMQVMWLVPWEEGTIEAVAYRKGKEIARTSQKTSLAPSKLNCYKYEDTDLGDQGDISIITIRQEDENSTLYPYGENRVYVKILGSAKVLSFENGNPVDVENNYDAKSKKCFFGLNRIFIESTGAKGDVSVIFAAISGDKKLFDSNKVSISTQEIALRGNPKKKDLEIRYTTDGSNPTKSSTLYTGAFEISLGTSVKAIVYNGEDVVFEMQENFTQDEGLYWGTPEDYILEDIGEQAEAATLKKARVVEGKGLDYKGKGYVVFEKAGGSIEFYQENDGGSFECSMSIRYAQQFAGNKDKTLKLYNNAKFIKNLNFKNTGSEDSKWEEITTKIKIHSGANNIKLEATTDKSPSIDQIYIKM